MDPIEETMTQVKSTKGTVVYDSTRKGEEGCCVPTIYIRKSVLGGRWPESLTLTITEDSTETS